jgi:transposase
MMLEQEQEFERLRAENAELRQQLAVALERIVELEAQVNQRRDPPAFAKPQRQKAPKDGPRKKRAAEHNTARKRMVPTRIERHGLDRCPECAYRLTGESLDDSREVIELPPPQPVEVIEHQGGQALVSVLRRLAQPAPGSDGASVRARSDWRAGGAALVAYLRTTLRLPVRQIQTYLATLHDRRLSVGEIVELGHDVRQLLQGPADRPLVDAREQAAMHQDETGWRENGTDGYVWTAAYDGPHAVRHYVYSPSRGHQVPLRLLGPSYQGVLVTDFYAAYNQVPGRHQRCWTHLLRDLHALKEVHAAQDEVVAWTQAVRRLYDEAHTWLTTERSLTERRSK